MTPIAQVADAGVPSSKLAAGKPGKAVDIKKRASSKRSANGCGNCKERHVKCDERKPACLRCEQAQRTCRGYEAPKRKWSRAGDFKIVTFGNNIATAREFAPANAAGQLAFEYFWLRTLPLLRRFGYAKLWTKNALQLIDSAPVLRHVAVAIGLQHMQLNNDYQGASDVSVENIRHYTRAIRSFRDSLSSEDKDMNVISLACLLFTLSESLQNRPRQVLVHLRNGIRLIEEDHDRRISSYETDVVSILRTLNNNSLHYDPERLIAMRNQQQADAKQWHHLETDATELEALTSDVNNLSMDTFHFILKTAFRGIAEGSAASDELSRIQSRAEYVSRALEALHADADAKGDAGDRFACSILLARSIVANTFAKAHKSPRQTAYDTYLSSYRRIVDLVRTSLDDISDASNAEGGKTEPRRPLFSIGTGIISSLAATISQCRHPTVRREALELLKRCPRREGVWDADDAYKIGLAQIAFEEARAIKRDPDGDDEEDWGLFIPEENRIHFTERVEPSAENGFQKQIIVRWRPEPTMKCYSKKTIQL